MIGWECQVSAKSVGFLLIPIFHPHNRPFILFTWLVSLWCNASTCVDGACLSLKSYRRAQAMCSIPQRWPSTVWYSDIFWLTAWQCRCWHGMLSWQIWTLIQKFKILAPVSERSANGSGLVSASSHMLLTDAKVAVAAVFKNGVGWCVAIHSTEHFLCISAKSVVGTSLLFPPLKSKKSTWKAKARVCHCWVCAGRKLLHMLDSLLQAHE